MSFTNVLQDTRQRLDRSQKLLDQILAVQKPRDKTNTLEIYNQIGIELDAAASWAGLMFNVHPDKAVRDQAETAEQEVSRFATDLALNRKLYDAIAAVDTKGLDSLSRRFFDKTLRDFKRSGVDKDETTRVRVKKLNEELVQIGQEFDRNIREDKRFVELDSDAELDGLPRDYIDAHKPGENGKIRITTEYPDFVPFMMYAKSDEARRKIAYEFSNRAYPKNVEVLKQLLTKRKDLAQVLGYSNWAAYATEDKMIKSADSVAKFVDEVAELAKSRADRDYAELLEVKRRFLPNTSSATEIKSWERSYIEEIVKRESYAFDSQTVRPYFEFGRVKQGLLELTSEMFGIRYIPAKDAKVWHESVESYDVVDSTKNQPLGRIYLDLHPRSNKYDHAAQFTLRSGVQGRQLPEGVLVCNFPDPARSSGPALMEHGDVVTFFHEFGHLLHHVFGGHQSWIRFSGVATEWDFVEAPSQLLEEWAWDAQVLRRFAKHAQTGEAISEEMVHRMRVASEFGEGLHARQQMFYAALSLQYHSQDPAKFDSTKLMRELQSKYSLFNPQEGTHFQLSFGHLNGYSAIYYTYMWSLVIAKDLFTKFQEGGLLNRDLARSYRKSVLEAGGSKDAADLVSDFLGRPYSFDAFRKWLNQEDSR